MTIARTACLLGLLATAATGPADEPRPSIALRLERPDLQARAIIDLFRGSRAPHPAAALAAWKRASREPNRLGKPLEALIAAINPAMAGEIRIMDDADLAIWFEAEGGQPAWGACLPGDDGPLAALATALVLSGGAAEAPMEGLAVDRLGPPGSALMARGPRALLVAGSREALKEARVRSDRPRGHDRGEGIRFAVDRGALDGAKSLALLRLNALLGEARGPITGGAALKGSTLGATLSIGLPEPAKPATVAPSWLDGLPMDRAMLAFAVAVDPAPATWDAAFRVADQVEKVDPARLNLAPVRLRLDLLARTLGLRTDGELLPHLRGVVGWLGGDGRTVDRALLTLLLDDEAVAVRIFEGVKPLPNPGRPPEAMAGPARGLGQVEGRPLRLHRSGRSVVATWGDGVMEASLEARGRPERSAGALFRDVARDPPPAFVAATWPARWPGLVPADTPLAVAIAEAPPILCSGTWENPGSLRIEAVWKGLDAAVRRFLGLIPLDPPPDH